MGRSKGFKGAIDGVVGGLDEVLNGMFDESNVDIEITLVKFTKYIQCCKQLVSHNFKNIAGLHGAAFENGYHINEMLEFCNAHFVRPESHTPVLYGLYKRFVEMHSKYKGASDQLICDTEFTDSLECKIFFKELTDEINVVENGMKESIIIEFKGIQKCTFTNSIVTVLSSLVQYARYLNDAYINSLTAATGKPKPSFIVLISASTYTPLSPFSSIDFKSDLINKPELTTDYLTNLKDIYTNASIIYDVVTTPNININKFIQTYIGAICTLEKDLPDCVPAFNELRNSAKMLTVNFGDQYREFLVTGNQLNFGVNMFQSIAEGAQSTKVMSAGIIRQFKKIMRHVNKKLRNAPKIGSVGKLTGRLAEMIKVIDRAGEDGEPADESAEKVDDDSKSVASEVDAEAEQAADDNMKQLIEEEEREKKKDRVRQIKASMKAKAAAPRNSAPALKTAGAEQPEEQTSDSSSSEDSSDTDDSSDEEDDEEDDETSADNGSVLKYNTPDLLSKKAMNFSDILAILRR